MTAADREVAERLVASKNSSPAERLRARALELDPSLVLPSTPDELRITSSALSALPRGLQKTVGWAIANTYPDMDRLARALLTEKASVFIMNNVT